MNRFKAQGEITTPQCECKSGKLNVLCNYTSGYEKQLYLLSIKEHEPALQVEISRNEEEMGFRA